MKTYLITGGAGFIGSNYIKFLLEKDRDIKVINLDKLTYAGNLENLANVDKDPRYMFCCSDICETQTISALFEQVKIDYVVNFAAESHVDRSIENPRVFVETNVNGTVNLLNAVLKAWTYGDGLRKGVRFMQISTDEVYGSLGVDGYFTEETPIDPRSPYSASKASADMMVKAFHHTYGLPINITRCSNNYGAYQFPEKLIPLMVCNAIKHKELPVYGDGLYIRDWLHVQDHCRAIECILHDAQAGEVYNIGGNNEWSNIDIVKIIVAQLSKSDPKITLNLLKHITDRKGHDRRYAIDASKIKRDLGWEPQISFKDGIVQVIKWYQENPAWIEHVISGEYQEYYQRVYGMKV